MASVKVESSDNAFNSIFNIAPDVMADKAPLANGDGPANQPAGDQLATVSLDQLQSKDYRQMLDVVDRLRVCGLDTMLQLPQLVVCGSQSAGKSSVLEAITEVPFPRKEGLCTRFATQIVMRRDPKESIQTKIIPDKTRNDTEQAKLQAFSKSISDFSELPSLIEEAAELMDLKYGDSTGGAKAFSRDVLSIDIAGPNKLQLTLVDLPGLVNSATKDHSDDDVTLIHHLVQDYVSEDRTIMLAVISAKDDLGNQGILKKCRAVDPDGHRTLGVVTKPDYIRSQASKQHWKQVVLNQNVRLELGWHIMKNRTEDEMDDSFEERNAKEASFFSQDWYRDLPAGKKGVQELRLRLAHLLYRHLKKELPKLKSEVNKKHGEIDQELQQLGDKRSTAAEQKRFLMSVSNDYQLIVNSAVDGHYEHPFFGIIETETGFDSPHNLRRLRAAVQHMNLQFASQMRQYGHKFRIMATNSSAEDDLPEPPLSEDYMQGSSLQQKLTRAQAVQWVKDILIRTRGRELPGNFNPLLLSQLFWEQSENWGSLARDHLERIASLCSKFVDDAVEHIVIDDIGDRLLVLKVSDALKSRSTKASNELRLLLEDKDRPPITYDPAYTAKMKDSRERQFQSKLEALIANAQVRVNDADTGKTKKYVNPEILLQNAMKSLNEPDMDKASAEDALDSQLAYYKDKVKYFIAAVTDQVVERHLLHNLAEETLSPLIINDMSDAEVGYVAAEAEEVTHKREYLESQKLMLENGQEAFRKALGSYK